MNIYSLIAFVLAGAVFFVGVFTSTDNVSAFIDGHAALIVFGGTAAVAAISFQIDRIYAMLKVFYYRVVMGKKVDYRPTIVDLMKIAEAYKKGDAELDRVMADINDFFIHECMENLRDGFLSFDEMKHIWYLRVNTIYYRYNEDAKKFKALGKFPPAMGLMGAVLGMIALLQTLGQPGAEDNVGPAMAIAMVATLYGIAFANLFILPIAENLMESTREIFTKNRIIVEGMLLIAKKKNKIILAEELNSYLLPAERINWKDLETSSKQEAA
jgi:chemotaxis protein MotA